METAVVEAARFLSTRVGERLKLADVADHVGYSPFHLARAFEARVGIPPGRFLAAHRFQLAKRLLIETDEKVVDVCFAAGFSSLGSFTSRFGSAVGSSPAAFRRLPDVLADAPAEPLTVPGRLEGGGTVSGRVVIASSAVPVVGTSPVVYLGLFPRRAATGFPVSGALLAEPGEFFLSGVPPGRYFLLASAFSSRADVVQQLLPALWVVGGAREPVEVTPSSRRHRRDVLLDVQAQWWTPVLVALPRLASPETQDWRSLRRG